MRPEIFPAAIVLKMSKNEVAEFWQEQANSGRLIPSVAGALFIHQIQKTQMNGFFDFFFYLDSVRCRMALGLPLKEFS